MAVYIVHVQMLPDDQEVDRLNVNQDIYNLGSFQINGPFDPSLTIPKMIRSWRYWTIHQIERARIGAFNMRGFWDRRRIDYDALSLIGRIRLWIAERRRDRIHRKLGI